MKIINKQPGAFLQNLVKSYTEGVYADTPANRKLGRVGMSYAAYKEKTEKKSEESQEKTWDTTDSFYKKGSDENKLWDSWYKFQKSGDHSHISDMRQILEKKFPDIKSWKQTSPNTGKAELTALNKDGDKVASIKLDGDKVDLASLQTFMDKCHVGKSETEILVNKTETLKNAEGKRLDAIIKYSNSAKEEGVEGIKVAKNATDEEKKIAIAKFYFDASEGDAENLDSIVEDALADYVPENKKEKVALSNISVKGEDKYKFVIGKSPKGKGNWAFQIGNDDVEKDPSKIFFVEGMYEEAKKKAKKEAQKRGDTYSITLLT